MNTRMNAPKDPRFTIRMSPELHEWFKAYVHTRDRVY